MMLRPVYPVSFGDASQQTPAQTPTYCLTPPGRAVAGAGFITFATWASGLLSVTALVMEHRGYKHASVAILVGVGVTGAFLAAIRAHCKTPP